MSDLQPKEQDSHLEIAPEPGSFGQLETWWLKTSWQTEWQQVTKKEWVAAEAAAGFYGGGPGQPATGAFGSGSVSGKRVRYVER